MLKLNIPEQLEQLVLYYSEPPAFDGSLLNGLSLLLERFSIHLRIHILSTDTFGSVGKVFSGSPHTVSMLPILLIF